MEVESLVLGSASATGDPNYNMMVRMNWCPGESLGRNKTGVRIPIGLDLKDNYTRIGLGYSEIEGIVQDIPSQIVELLKLKVEQLLIDSNNELNAVFDEESTNKTDTQVFKSELLVQIFDENIVALLDTGSDITCISEEFWNSLVERRPSIPVMPIKSFLIKTAVGQKSVEIKKIALVTLGIGPFERDITVLIVPGLSANLILGFDWMKENQASIKLNREEEGVEIIIGEEKRLFKFFKGNTVLSNCKSPTDFDVSMLDEENVDENIRGMLQKSKLDKDKQKVLEEVLMKHRSLFTSRLGRANCYEHVIAMEPHTPVVKRTYPIPYAYRDKVEAKLMEMEEQGIISRSTTPYCSPLTFTLKRDGSIRVLLDAREINKYMIAETEKPPLQLDVLNSFHGAKFISIVDLKNAYYQIPLTEASKKYTGFSFNGKSYVYNVLPQGLKTSVGSFSRGLDIILGHEVRDFCINYLDDLAIITTGTLSQHLEHIDIVLGKLSQAGLTCNLEKCEFLSTEVKMLGYIISTDGIRTDPEKVRAIQLFPTPKKLKQVRAFLGLCNFYRKFIPNYSFHTGPLCELLKKERKWKWGESEQEAFDKIKSLFINTVELNHPDFTKPYYLQTDSSGIGLAGFLYQKDNQGEIKILGFHSKLLRGAQLNWTVTEQELYSIICCLEKFETYLRGAKVIIRTDHKALTFVKNSKLYNARVTRWINYLEQFQYVVQHVKGRDNVVADVLSRYQPEGDLLQEDKTNSPRIFYTERGINKELLEKLKDLARLQREDVEIGEIIRILISGVGINGRVSQISKRCVLGDGILYYLPGEGSRKVLFLPESIREEVIWQVHFEMGHQGAYKIIKYIRDRFFWKGLTKQVKRLLKGCHDCQITKSDTAKYVGPCRSIITENVGDIVMADLYGPLPSGKFGMNYILVVQDSFSKFVKFYDLRKATAISVLTKVRKFFRIIKPRAIMTDNGSQFASRMWKEVMKEEGVRVIYTTVRNPRPNTTERVNKELGRLFRTYCRTNHKGWVDILPKLEVLYNNTYHESTGFTPCEILYSEPTRLSFDDNLPNGVVSLPVDEIREKARENLRKAGQLRQNKFNEKYRIIQYQIGDLVKIRKLNKSDAKLKITKKFEPLYEGPYVVGANPFKNVYLLVDPKSGKERGRFNTIHLSRYYK